MLIIVMLTRTNILWNSFYVVAQNNSIVIVFRRRRPRQEKFSGILRLFHLNVQRRGCWGWNKMIIIIKESKKNIN